MPRNEFDQTAQPSSKDCSATISAVALATLDMAASVQFYEALGFKLTFGGVAAPFSSLRFGQCFVNLALREIETPVAWWGRVIFHVPDVDAVYDMAMVNGFDVEAPPRDAPWGERYFHITDPAGHQLSFAKPL